MAAEVTLTVETRMNCKKCHRTKPSQAMTENANLADFVRCLMSFHPVALEVKVEKGDWQEVAIFRLEDKEAR